MNYDGKQDLKLKPQSNDTLGYISISIFWLSLLLWGFSILVNGDAFSALGSIGGSFRILVGIVLPTTVNIIGLVVGIFGLSSLKVKTHKYSNFGTVLNILTLVVGVPLILLFFRFE